METIKKNEGLAAAQPKEPGAHGRTFTQEEVNKIVSERLQKERVKLAAEAQSQEPQLSQREQNLAARENRLTCLEYLRTQDLPQELLEIVNTEDAAKFRQRIARLLELCPALDKRSAQPPVFSLESQGRRDEFSTDPFAAAFGRK